MGTLYYVEGGIGVGKSTYVREISKRLNLRPIEEPVNSNPFLKPFYKDPKRHGSDMQMYLLHRRIGLQMLGACEALYSPDFSGAMLDRTIFGDRVFLEVLYADGLITDLQYHMYLTAVRSMQLMIYPPTVLIFLDAEPSIALKRIKERARGCEVTITIDYLEKLARGYHRLVQDAKNGRYPWSHAVKVLHKSWNHDTMTSEQWDAEASSLRRFQEEIDAAANPEWKKDPFPLVGTCQVSDSAGAASNGSGNGVGSSTRDATKSIRERI